jgi:uncharacterized protein YhhL (DUF1145 family)
VRPARFLIVVLTVDLVICVVAMLLGEKPHTHFGKRGFITYVAASQILLAGVFSFTVWSRRKAGEGPTILWLLLGLGFVFLALDDALELHEKLDDAIHDLAGLDEADRTDRIDDLIVLVYGIVGAAVLIACRRELLRFRGAVRYLALAFGFAVLMIGLDLLTNQRDWVEAILGRSVRGEGILPFLRALEDTMKVLATGTFAAALYHCRFRANGFDQGSSVAE